MRNNRLLSLICWLVSATFYGTLFFFLIVLPWAIWADKFTFSVPIEGVIGDLPNRMVYQTWMRAQVSQARLLVYNWSSFLRVLGQPVGFALITLTTLRVLLKVAILWWVKQLFDTIRQQSPFDPAISQRLQWIGIALLTLPMLQFLGQFVSIGLAQQYTTQLGIAYSFHSVVNLSVGDFLTGGIVLVMAQIFRYGTQLQHEQDLTV